MDRPLIVLCDHQTGYLPWIGFFHRVSLCDVYVSLDTVKFNPSSFDDRNKIKTPEGFKWLKVPTLKSESGILKDIKINHSLPWADEHLKAIRHSYSGTRYFDYYFKKIEGILSKKHAFLMELNEDLVRFFFEELDIHVRFAKASEHPIKGSKNEYLINLCKRFDARVYVFGQFGADYVEKALWEQAGIHVHFHQYTHPVYEQKFNNFESHLSILDLLLHKGAVESRKILRAGNITREQMLKTMDVV